MQDSQQHATLSLLSGPLAAVILGIGIAGLALMVPGYSQVHQMYGTRDAAAQQIIS
jgi:hypothetical protein